MSDDLTEVTRVAPATIRSRRWVGTRLNPDDLPDFQAFYADPDVMATLSADGRTWPTAEAEALFERHLRHWEAHGFGTWIFRDPEDGTFVARAGLRSVDVGRGPEVELFYGVDSSMWSRGIATEVASALIDTAFTDLGLSGLVGFTLPTNGRSQRVLEKCGFARHGDFEHAGLRHLLFRLSDTAWAAHRSR